MKVIQQAQVEQETMELIAKKAKIQSEFDEIAQQIRDRHVALAELMEREKSFEASFIGNAEWLKRIKELRVQFNEAQNSFDSMKESCVKVEEELKSVRDALDGSRISLIQINREREIARVELDSTRLTNSGLLVDQKALQATITTLKAQIEEAHNKAIEMDEEKALKMSEIFGKEASLAKKERDLRVYEERIVREYAIIFPDTEVKV